MWYGVDATFLQALRRGYATALGAEVVKVCVGRGGGGGDEK